MAEEGVCDVGVRFDGVGFAPTAAVFGAGFEAAGVVDFDTTGIVCVAGFITAGVDCGVGFVTAGADCGVGLVTT